MATWTKKQAGYLNGQVIRHIATDGTNIYLYDPNTDRYHVYDPVANTATEIDDNGVTFPPASTDSPMEPTPGSLGAGLVWFSGKLYTLRRGDFSTTDGVQVWRYDGGTTWTQVFTNNTAFAAAIFSYNGQLVITGETGAIFGSPANTTWYSANGTAWTQGTFNSGSGFIYTSGTGATGPFNGLTLGLFLNFDYNDAGGDGLFQYSTDTNAWANIDDEPGFSIVSGGPDFYWRVVSVPPNRYDRSTDLLNWTTPTQSAYIPVRQINMPYSTAYEISGTNALLYFWDSDAGEWGATSETLALGRLDGMVEHLVRLSNNKVYAIVSDVTSPVNDIFERDEALPDPAGPGARFYFAPAGQSLTEKFTLPFPGVAANAMTLDRILGTVVIGSDRAAVDPVIYSTYPYPTGTVTDSGFPTGTSVQALRWV